MPSEIKTKNLGLNQWQGNEYLKREDLNEDNEKIDKAFGEVSKEIEGIEVTAKKTKLDNPNFKSDNVDGALTELFQCGVDGITKILKKTKYIPTTPPENMSTAVKNVDNTLSVFSMKVKDNFGTIADPTNPNTSQIITGLSSMRGLPSWYNKVLTIPLNTNGNINSNYPVYKIFAKIEDTNKICYFARTNDTNIDKYFFDISTGRYTVCLPSIKGTKEEVDKFSFLYDKGSKSLVFALPHDNYGEGFRQKIYAINDEAYPCELWDVSFSVSDTPKKIKTKTLTQEEHSVMIALSVYQTEYRIRKDCIELVISIKKGELKFCRIHIPTLEFEINNIEGMTPELAEKYYDGVFVYNNKGYYVINKENVLCLQFKEDDKTLKVADTVKELKILNGGSAVSSFNRSLCKTFSSITIQESIFNTTKQSIFYGGGLVYIKVDPSSNFRVYALNLTGNQMNPTLLEVKHDITGTYNPSCINIGNNLFAICGDQSEKGTGLGYLINSPTKV